MLRAPLAISELLARLCEGLAAQITVVTPNDRLARELVRQFDETQIGRGLAVWEAADVLPFAAFVERLYQDALYSEFAAELPSLLSVAQQRELWEAVIRASDYGATLLTASQTAAECHRTWELAHSWRVADALGTVPGSDDAEVYAAWARDYARRCASARYTDMARIPDIVVPLLKAPALRKPRLLVPYAFDVVTPQQRDFFEACAERGVEVQTCAPARRGGVAARAEFASAREELAAAARWARVVLARGAKRIGVVVPDLQARRKEVARVFASTMHPAYCLPGSEPHVQPFNISLGASLAHYPLVHAAISLVELAVGEVDFEHASRLLRSPFLGGGDKEMAARARLDADLRKRAPHRLTLGRLVALVQNCALLRERLEALLAVARGYSGGERSPHDWARHFSAVLDAAGFPGRTLNSMEFQTQARFEAALAELAALDCVAPTMSGAHAVSRLRRLCEEILFQPETPVVPIQVLGVLESAGLAFDALWVSGLTDEAWPLPARPNPFIPYYLQRRAGIPEASAEAAFAFAKEITERWLRAANEVVMSHSTHEEDRELRVSALIAEIPVLVEEAPLATHARYRDLIFAARHLQALGDGKALPLGRAQVRSGVRILADQASCPFRAFARHRLGAESLERPVAAPSAIVRGNLVHLVMKALWEELGGSEALRGNCSGAIERAAAAAVRQERIEEPFAALERARLTRTAAEWLEVERQRQPFYVVMREQSLPLRAGGLEFLGRIDRMDRLASGGYALIDYKTGAASRRDWLDERPEEPQLPLYAINVQQDIRAIAFAKLKPGDLAFSGYAREKGLLPKVERYGDWETLIAGWRNALDTLGADFVAGDARVAPKNMLATCRQCDLQPLCRVYERLNPLAEEAGSRDD